MKLRRIGIVGTALATLASCMVMPAPATPTNSTSEAPNEAMPHASAAPTPPSAPTVTRDGEPARTNKNGDPAPKSEFAHMGDVGVFGAGRCEFSDCMKNGWSVSYRDNAKLSARCNFGKCWTDGWTTTVEPGGKRFETRCNFSDCGKNGWTTTVSGGPSINTRCEFSDCMKNGWTTESGSARSRTTCNFQNCNKNGWTTEASGRRISCSCNFSDCLKNGAECRE